MKTDNDNIDNAIIHFIKVFKKDIEISKEFPSLDNIIDGSINKDRFHLIIDFCNATENNIVVDFLVNHNMGIQIKFDNTIKTLLNNISSAIAIRKDNRIAIKSFMDILL